VNYEIGDRIDKKAFCEIDPTFINLNIKRTRQNIKQLEYNQQRINSRVLYLKKEFERVKNLFKRQSVSEVRMDEASKNLDQAQFELNAVAQEIAARQTTLEELLERKKRHSIYAPKGWSVISKTVEAGDIVSTNMVLAKIADFRELVVPLAVSTEELQALKALPRPLDVFIEGQAVKAAIHWVNPEFNEATRKLDIELILSEYDGEKYGGLFFKLPLPVATEGLLIPKAAVVNRYENPKVTLAESGEVVSVEVLREFENDYLIAETEKLPLDTLLQTVNGNSIE